MRGLLSAALLSVSCSLFAQEADTLIASRVVSPQNLPVIKPVRSMSLDGGVAVEDLADALARFTSVQVRDYGGEGGLKTVNVRSLGSQHVGVFLDGIQIENAQNMQVDLGRFSLADMQAVSLYNGQKSARLQSAREYAAGSSIYLTTRMSPADAPWHILFRGGSFGTLNAAVRYRHNAGPVKIRASAEALHSDGGYPYPFFDTTLVRENGDIRSFRLEAAAEGNIAGTDCALMLYSYGSERGFPGPVIKRAAGFPLSAERQEDQDIFLQGSAVRDWDDRNASALRFKLTRNFTHYDSHPERNPMAIPSNVTYRQSSAYVSWAQSYTVDSRWSLDAGVDFQRNVLDSDAGRFVFPSRNSLSGVVAARYAGKSLKAAAHVVYLGALDSYSGGEDYRGAWMPSVSVSWQIDPFWELDFFAKRSYRLPTFNDLYYTLIGNTSLRPESAMQVGADLKFSARGFSAGLSPYYNRVTDKIVAIPTSTLFRWSMLNIGIADIAGADAFLSWSGKAGVWTLGGSLSYSFQIALDHTSPGMVTYGLQLPYAPMHSGVAELSAGVGKFSVGAVLSFTGDRWSAASRSREYYLPPLAVLDANLSWQATSWLRAVLTLKNITDSRYSLVQGYPMPGVSANMSVVFSL